MACIFTRKLLPTQNIKFCIGFAFANTCVNFGMLLVIHLVKIQTHFLQKISSKACIINLVLNKTLSCRILKNDNNYFTLQANSVLCTTSHILSDNLSGSLQVVGQLYNPLSTTQSLKYRVLVDIGIDKSRIKISNFCKGKV